MEKLKNIPSLRFPEFDGEWNLQKIGEITDKVNSGKTPLGGESVYVENGVLFIRSQNVLDSKLSFENSTFITEAINNTMKNSVVKSNDILLNITGASLGRSCVVPNDFTIGNVNQHVCIIRLNKENNPYFLQPIFSSAKGQNIFTSLQTGSGREGLNFQSIRGMALSFPSLTEQTKIASFLTAVDYKLQALKQKKTLLEQYKKGVMQKIFSQELRFKDDNGNEYPDWEEKKIWEICDVIIGGTPSTTKEEYWNGNIGWIGSGELKNGLITKPTKYITELGLKKSSTYLMPKGTTVLAMTGATIGKIGYLDFDSAGNQSVAGFLNLKNIYSLFLFYQMQVNTNQILTLAGGAAQTGINKSNIESLRIQIPNLEEQTKIANFLSAIDDKINHCESQIEKTEVWKKGLLQQMFC